MWAGKFVRLCKRGNWEYASRANDIRAVVILAEYEGKVILIDQPRVAPDCRCVELPAGLVGDDDPRRDASKTTAVKELEEETGFTAERIERLGDFYASPGMLSESFTLVRAHGVRRIGEGGGDDNEDIAVHLVARADIPNFLEQKRAEGFGDRRQAADLHRLLNSQRGGVHRRMARLVHLSDLHFGAHDPRLVEAVERERRRAQARPGRHQRRLHPARADRAVQEACRVPRTPARSRPRGARRARQPRRAAVRRAAPLPVAADALPALHRRHPVPVHRAARRRRCSASTPRAR